MARLDDWKTGRCLGWCTELPNADRHRDSPIFVLDDKECYFQFVRTPVSNDDHCYYIYLMQKDTGVMNFRSLSVTVFARFKKHITNVLNVFTYSVPSTNRIIWSVSKSYLEPRLSPDYQYGNALNFDFFFHGTDAAKLKVFEIKSEDKTVQADLEFLSLDLKELLDSAAVPDVSVECKDGAIHAHRAILVARSKVFSTMFHTDMKEKLLGVLDMTDVDSETIKLFMEFVYSGKFQDLPIETAPDIYALGDKYQIFSLKKMCSDFMIKNLSEENYVSFLELSDAHNDEYFRSAVIDYITNHRELMNIKERDGWSEFCKKHNEMAFEIYQHCINKCSLHK